MNFNKLDLVTNLYQNKIEVETNILTPSHVILNLNLIEIKILLFYKNILNEQFIIF